MSPKRTPEERDEDVDNILRSAVRATYAEREAQEMRVKFWVLVTVVVALCAIIFFLVMKGL